MFEKRKERKAIEEMKEFVAGIPAYEAEYMKDIKDNLEKIENEEKKIHETLERAKYYDGLEYDSSLDAYIYMIKECWKMGLGSLYLAKDYVLLGYYMIISKLIDGKYREELYKNYNIPKYQSTILPPLNVKEAKGTPGEFAQAFGKSEVKFISDNPKDLEALHKFWLETGQKALDRYNEIFNEVMNLKKEYGIKMDLCETEVKELSVFPTE